MIPDIKDMEVKKKGDKIQLKETRTEIHEREYTAQDLEAQKARLQDEINKIDALIAHAAELSEAPEETPQE